MVLDEVEDQEECVAREYMKYGAANTLAVCASLRRNEVFLLDLVGLWRYIDLRQEGKVPQDPMKTGTDLSSAPPVIVKLIGEFKGETGTRHYLISLANVTSSGIKMRCWLEEFMRIKEKEGYKSGPSFDCSNGSLGLMSKYDDILHLFLRKVQEAHPNIILPTDEVEANYGFSWTFRRTAKSQTRGVNLDSGVQNAMNRWRKIEEAKGKHPQFNMMDHYSHA